MDTNALFVKMSLNAWSQQVDRATKLFNELSDDQVMKEIAPGKNRGVYLFGHLIAIHDVLVELLGIGKKEHPELQPLFLESPDKKFDQIPSVAELRALWSPVHDRLKTAFAAMTPNEWLSRHTAMTDADFEKEPWRNKLSVLITRTNHLAYHLGQIRLLK